MILSPLELAALLDREGLPNLLDDGLRKTSEATRSYNCIAWAADDMQNWWWPVTPYYWPPGVPHVVHLTAFVAAYGTIGYLPCGDGSFEVGFEKVAIYCSASGDPTHAARQTDTSLWTSKLGQFWDVEHRTPQGVEGRGYGITAQYLRRPIQDVARVQARLLFLLLLAA